MNNRFSERLKELRTDKKLSYESLGKQVGISHTSLFRWENNQADITSDNLIILANFFGVSVGYLLGLED